MRIPIVARDPGMVSLGTYNGISGAPVAAPITHVTAVRSPVVDRDIVPPQGLADGPDVVDAVYTWVDGSDPAWLAVARPIFAAAGLVHDGDAGIGDKDNKFRDWGELLFSMRSLAMFAPWVRNVYIVTSGPTQVPSWLNTSHPRVRVVYHAQLFDDPGTQLPTFNSFAIESVLHRIHGLSNRFLYLNNDFLLARPTALSDFATPSTYFQYRDWVINLSPPCRYALLTGRDDGVSPSVAGSYAACRGDLFGWDSVLALHYFKVLVTHWFGHIPHLLERRVLYAVEAALGEHLAACRRNKLRDPRTDVNIHVQYEAWRTAAARRGDAGEPAVEPRELPSIMMSGLPAYRYVVFDNGSDGTFYARLALSMNAELRPLFFAIDDDTLRPSPEVLAYHRERLTAFFQRHWPEPAPWELGDRVPPVLNPAAFVASPPPPTVMPWAPP